MTQIHLAPQNRGFILPFIMIIALMALIISLGFYQSLTGNTASIITGNEKTKANISAEDALNQIEINIIRSLDDSEALKTFASSNACQLELDDKTGREHCKRISTQEFDQLANFVKNNINYNPSGNKGNFKRFTASNSKNVIFYNIRVHEQDEVYLFITTVASFDQATLSALESGFQTPK